MKSFHDLVNAINAPLWDLLVIVLIIVGLFFSFTTRFVQIRLFITSIKEIIAPSNGDKDQGISAFHAFVTGLASRVGTGNIAGVAIAISLGGPGAIFWMWLTAFIGMSSAFAESSLAQLFKIKDKENNLFYGGPAYYITQGLKQRWLAILFALSLILAFGFVFNAVQANTIVAASSHAWGFEAINISDNFSISWVGLVIVILTALSIFGGVKRVAKIAASIVPVMAILYLALTLIIMAMNIELVGHVFKLIFSKAFDFNSAAGGIFGGLISSTMMQGIKRGLFSNEAGMGSAPNAAAASNVRHPINQGLIQMLGVFVDTFIVCSCTAVIVIISQSYLSTDLTGIQLTQNAIESGFGKIGGDLLAIILFLFAFSSIIGNYVYAESNVRFIYNCPKLIFIFRLLVLCMVYFGAVNSVPLVWDMADLSMGLMAMINLIAIVLLSPYVFMLLKDYQAQRKVGRTPSFSLDNYPHLKEKINNDVW